MKKLLFLGFIVFMFFGCATQKDWQMGWECVKGSWNETWNGRKVNTYERFAYTDRNGNEKSVWLYNGKKYVKY